MLVFIGPEAVQDGIKVEINSVDTNVQIYDYSFLIARVYSDKANGIYGR